MAALLLNRLKKTLTAFGSVGAVGAMLHALPELKEHPLSHAALVGSTVLAAEVAAHFTFERLRESLRDLRAEDDIFENEHLTRIVGETIAIIVARAAREDDYASDRASLNILAGYVKENWRTAQIRDDTLLAGISDFNLPNILTGDAAIVLQTTALTPAIWAFVLYELAALNNRNLSTATTDGVSTSLHEQFARVLFGALAEDFALNGEAYPKIALLISCAILSTSRQTMHIVEMIRMDTGDILKNNEEVIGLLQQILGVLGDRAPAATGKRAAKDKLATRHDTTDAAPQISAKIKLEIGGATIRLKIMVPYSEVGPALVSKLEQRLRALADDETVTIRDVREGSVIVTIDGTSEGIERLRTLGEFGELDRAIGLQCEVVDDDGRLVASRRVVEPSDRTADELFRKHIVRLTDYIGQRFPSIDYQEVAAISLHSVIKKMPPPESDRRATYLETLYPYARRIAMENAFREDNRQRPIQGGLVFDAFLSTERAPDEVVIARMAGQEIARALAYSPHEALRRIVEVEQPLIRGLRELPAMERRILVMRFVQEYTYEEIANNVGTTVAHVRSSLQHAMQRLRRRFEEFPKS